MIRLTKPILKSVRDLPIDQSTIKSDARAFAEQLAEAASSRKIHQETIQALAESQSRRSGEYHQHTHRRTETTVYQKGALSAR